jgi:hypothetical protein
MLTVKELCANMAATGRDLTPRAARDWWTKGLLLKPRRRRLGRGKGTETFWSDSRVMLRACAAWDLLAERRSADTAILGLWLQRFPGADLGFIRGSIHSRSIATFVRCVAALNGGPMSGLASLPAWSRGTVQKAAQHQRSRRTP